MGNPFSKAKKVYYDGQQLSRIYCNNSLWYSLVEPPAEVATEDLSGTASASDYEEGSTTFGSLELSEGTTVSEDGIEIQDQQTFASAADDNISYPMTLEFKGRVDSYTSSNPPMLWGMGNTVDKWGAGCICCYAHETHGLIIDSNGTARKIISGMHPQYVHIVFVINEQGTPTMYINGMNHIFSYTSDNACTGAKPYFYNGEGKGRFVGAINTMRWWDRNLTETEIEELFAIDAGTEYVLDEDQGLEYNYLAYEGTNLEFDGSTYIDTNIQLFDINKSFKIEISFTSTKSTYGTGNNIGTLLHCMQESSPWPGIVLDTNGSGYYRMATTKGSVPSTIPQNDTGSHILVVSYNIETGYATFSYDNSTTVQEISYTAVTDTAILGAYKTTSGGYGRYWQGTMEYVRIWFTEET